MNSRWTTNPIKRNGQIVSTRPNVPGDIDILKALGQYGTLIVDDIAALNGRSYGAVVARANLLKRKPNQLITVCAAQLEEPRLYQWSSQAFNLTNQGVGRLAELGFEARTPKPSVHFLHTLTEAQTAASFEIGTRRLGLKHVVIEKAPVPVTFDFKGKRYENHHLTPDGGPIGIGYPGDLYRFVVFETDLATEPLSSSNRDRQAIETKISAYLTVLQSRAFETHWRIPNLTVLFTTISHRRLNSMRELLASMTNDRRLLNCFAFQQFTTILSASPQPTDKGWAITQPWHRVSGQLNLGAVQ